MLFGSKRSRAPRSDASRAAFARAERSARSREKSIRCSQSTAMVAPRDAIFLFTSPPSSHAQPAAVHGEVDAVHGPVLQQESRRLDHLRHRDEATDRRSL